MKKTALVLLVGLAACSSSKKQDDPQPQPRVEESPSKTAPAAEEKTPPAKEEPIAITIKKGEKRGPEAAFKGEPPRGKVCFDFRKVDLEKVALPLFSKQAGVDVDYHGREPRTLTLSINQPEPWRDVLALICKFTSTHVVRSQIAGHLELKDGYDDPSLLLAKFDPNDKSGSQAGQGVLGAPPDGSITSSNGNTNSAAGTTGGGTTATSGGGASGGGAGSTYDTSDYQQPKQPGADRIDELRRGVTTTSSGVK